MKLFVLFVLSQSTVAVSRQPSSVFRSCSTFGFHAPSQPFRQSRASVRSVITESRWSGRQKHESLLSINELSFSPVRLRASPQAADLDTEVVTDRATDRATDPRSSKKATEKPIPKNLAVVITGGTKGVGFALAKRFLEEGDRVVVAGRSADSLANALAALRKASDGTASVFGLQCDVSVEEDIERLAVFAEKSLGTVDLWVNNAGSNANCRKPLTDFAGYELREVVNTNLMGTLLGCREAARLFKRQGKKGHVFLMDGAGVSGGSTKGYAAYGATKRAMPQLAASLRDEIKEAGLTDLVGVHSLSPGMVLTDLLVADSTPVTRKFFNAIAEEPEGVAADLVPRMRQVTGTGEYIKFLTIPQALFKIFFNAPAILLGGKFFDSSGNRVKKFGEEYTPNGVKRQY
uniref:Chlorophyll(Ide) b reductase n=1 Tax=Chromera velia CCMP2878 TaxID=1169474 RepID=A0A0G4HTZ8_9ALVE|mmetsp:Transcript_47529/g.93753  ORF Transcript_47529/g.93753 Transcript_47529/m.93753 type:complete len:404 (+) Transcript_47529:78-1289(+)|eukprot:Cvel_31653.t1-p1 / transcript=Cvel_31653.t1 / gene=Cvel_31653 / organism=Chromera_velia_CCMP2878 / gene_product=Chlorophyll(ide) b reductase NOL, chloroplastic, putative / transcript_product=Chlorophyll(ide) b reductase NOL, chloroplastic, putative / location=Cvel_scaffold4756:2087-5372(+) / protein_length=403 / sequence_SO=supercontig / SO=protein_coding / is_pseudo=false